MAVSTFPELFQTGYSDILLERARNSSVVASSARTMSMGSRKLSLPALAVIPSAKFVGTVGVDRTKPTSTVGWEDKTLEAREIAVIIRLNQEDVEDASVDVLTEVANLAGEAIGAALDAAVLFGAGKPAQWLSPDLVTAATQAEQVFQLSNTPGANDLAGSFYQAAGAVADAGFNPTAMVAKSSLKYRLANLRDNTASPIYIPSLNVGPGATDNVAGLNAIFSTNGAWDASKAEAIVFDPQRVILGIRTDIEVSFSEDAQVEGISLFENDQVALRLRARYAYALGDTINQDGTRNYPVAAITPAPVA